MSLMVGASGLLEKNPLIISRRQTTVIAIARITIPMLINLLPDEMIGANFQTRNIEIGKRPRTIENERAM